MAELVTTGISGLDDILRGGLRRGTCTLVEGVPGSGKTTLGLQFVCAGIEAGEPGLIITFEEFPQDLYEDAAGMGCDLREHEAENCLRVICTSPQVFLDQLSQAGGLVDTVTAEIGARRLLVDSVSHFSQVTSDPTQLRALVYSMLNGLKRARLTAVITKELDSAAPEQVPFEEYLADAVLRLTQEMGPDLRRRRYAEILKTRGRGHTEGKHAMRISEQGVRIYPRPRLIETGGGERRGGRALLSTGVCGLDEMLGGGIPRGFTVLVAGSAGVGKTTLGLSFMTEGAARGERGLLVCFEEPPGQLAQGAAACGVPLEEHLRAGTIEALHGMPLELLPEELLRQIEERVVEGGYQRVVVDSLTDLQMAMRDERQLQEWLFGLQAVCRRQGATVLLTTEVAELFGQSRVTSEHVSVMVDGIVLLKYLEMESEIQRALSVLKLRGCHHDSSIRRYVLDGEGFRVLARFEGAEGVMAGQVRRTRVQLATRSFTELDERLNDELLERFAASHPHIEPVGLRLPQNPDEAMAAVWQALSACPSTLTVAPIVQYWLPRVLEEEALLPLDELLPADRRGEYLEGLMAPATREGHLYAAPIMALAGIFYYRKDLLEKHGFAGPPRTWAELVEQAERVVREEEEEELHGFQFPSARYEMLTATFLSLLWSNGGEVQGPEGRVDLTGEQVAQTLEFMHGLMRTRGLSPEEILAAGFGVVPEQDFIAGRSVFFFGIPDTLPKTEKLESPVRERVGIGLLPVGPSGEKPATVLGGWHYGIPRTATAPGAAEEFIRFMTSFEVQKERALRGGTLPPLRALYDDPELGAFHPYYPALKEIVAAGRIRENIPRYLDFSQTVRSAVHRMLSGEVSPAEAQAEMVSGVAQV